MVGGKGGVGKTSLSASLAVRFANAGHATLVVSTDPAHSLSDSLAQDVTGGQPVRVEGTDAPLFALELDPEDAKAEIRQFASADGGKGVNDFMNSMGLGAFTQQLADLKLGELLDTPPPGLDEAMAIAKVVQFVDGGEFSQFDRIVFDTAPTGHTLRMLSLPDFLDATIGKVVRLRQTISGAGNAIKGMFGADTSTPDEAVEKLEGLKKKLKTVSELFRDQDKMEFVIACIPTVMAANESARLMESLKGEGVPVRRVVVNQLLPGGGASTTEAEEALAEAKERGDEKLERVLKGVLKDAKFMATKRKDQERALSIIDDELGSKGGLSVARAQLFDIEIRGVPALQFFGMSVWQ